MEKLLRRLVVLKSQRDKNIVSYSIKFFRLIMFQFTEIREKGIYWSFSLHISKIGISFQLESYHQKGWLI